MASSAPPIYLVYNSIVEINFAFLDTECPYLTLLLNFTDLKNSVFFAVPSVPSNLSITPVYEINGNFAYMEIEFSEVVSSLYTLPN